MPDTTSDPLFTPAPELPVGTRVERYVIEAHIGDGGMASVYRVKHEFLGSTHALKVLRPEYLHVPAIRKRFLDEGRIQANLRHPHICPVTDIVTDPIAGLVMDYLEGESLEDRLHRAKGPIPVDEVLDIAIPVLEALAFAHSCGCQPPTTQKLRIRFADLGE